MYSLGMTYSADNQDEHTTRFWDRRLRTRVDRSLADITDGRALDHVPDRKTLNGLVLADASRAVRATDEVDVAAALLVTTAA